MEITALGAIVALIIAIFLIIKQVPPAYGMIIGALIGGVIGGADLVKTISIMISGAAGMSSAILRIMMAGILAGVLMESGAAATIAETIIDKLGESKALISLTLATCVLTASGVFGDVTIITVAVIGLQIAKKLGISRLGVLIAMSGGVRAGNVMSPNPNAIAAAETFNLPLTSVMIGGMIPAVFGFVAACACARFLKDTGTKVEEYEEKEIIDKPSFKASIAGPLTTILILISGRITGFHIDPLIALPVGGIVGSLAMKKLKLLNKFATSGLTKMSGVVLLLLGTGTLSGIISHSGFKDLIISGVDVLGLPGFLLAPIAGITMGAATASGTAGTAVGCKVFGPAILAFGVAPIQAAVMIHAGSSMFDGLPHGSFFHVSAGSVGMTIKERLKLIPYEAIVGFMMALGATIFYGFLGLKF